ncbi:hypothetical protein [Deinococcus aquiradiocola]|uniref:Uncharacterized protein n=1 Tax=Deinococcus aquiradiocola TaxID=393059 RepID=A0A917PFS1_9DEIO|nr:hypothetical protein [Deinococcus aquiradiocola]GGJ75389.1 hypothetical protein GCM10008939_19560 [Deinococcus aquiradiocola]
MNANTAPYWQDVMDRIETARTDSATRHLLHAAPRRTVWASLLPPLRRLEGWLERHAGTPAPAAPSAPARA